MEERLGDRGLVILGISLDEADEPARRFCLEQSVDYPVARVDPAFNSAYGTLPRFAGSRLVRPDRMINATLPTFLIIDRPGRLRAMHVGSAGFPALEPEVRRWLRPGP